MEPTDRRFLLLYRLLLIATFCLICLGALVRSENAGLSCPDWPLCFGRYIPHYNPQVYFEFIHRVLAGSVSILVLFLHLMIFQNRKVAKSIKVVAALSLVLLGAQVLLGGLTVLKLLKAGIVTMHLATGTAFFGTLLWVYFRLTKTNSKLSQPPGVFAFWTLLVPAVIYGQILLGGWVASNYAGLACPDFPLCFGKWIPTLSGNIGIQVIHRFGAYTTALVIFANFIVAWAKREASWMDKRIVIWSRYLVTLVLIQILLGVTNVKFFLPPLVQVLHLATAVGLFAIALRAKFLALPSRVAATDGLS